MANTYVLIASNTLSSSAASVTFSSIPATYTDLVLKISAKSDRANNNDDIKLYFNTDTGANYSRTYLLGNGATASSSRNSATGYLAIDSGSNGGSEANTFSSTEIYIPNYRSSTFKPVGSMQVQEANSTTARIFANAGLWSQTGAITSIGIYIWTGPNFVSGSSFFLYGIKNS